MQVLGENGTRARRHGRFQRPDFLLLRGEPSQKAVDGRGSRKPVNHESNRGQMPKIRIRGEPSIRPLLTNTEWDTRRLAPRCEYKIDNHARAKTYETSLPNLDCCLSRLNFATLCWGRTGIAAGPFAERG